jgi:lysophospholipase
VRTRVGVLLRAMRAPLAGARGTVVVMGGRGDYMERYFETMRDMMARGFAVASFDFRGQGGSQRLLRNRWRGHIRSFRDFDEDLRAVMAGVVEPHCPKPYVAIAHSTGGNVLLRNLRQHDWFARAAVLAPLLGIHYGNWPRPAVRMLLFLAAATGLGWMFLPGHKRGPLRRDEFPGNPLSSDIARWRRDSGVLEAVPALGLGGATFAWLRAARASIAALQRIGPKDRLTCPVLLVVAGLDSVVDTEAMRRFARKAPGVSLVTIAESLHEVLFERDAVRDQFLAAFDRFVEG